MIKHIYAGASCLLVFLLFCNGCNSAQQEKSKEFSVSKVYPGLVCQADPDQSYALFLPPQYTREKPCPVLILFDPHGDGLLPVQLFSDEAAKKGFILAGSNNSKNGMPLDQTTSICRNILADISVKFAIEKKAVYLGGFSGGSRVAGAAAIMEGGIAGVIGCGAGLPNINQKPSTPFSYLAVAGNRDFNYAEMLQLNESLQQAGFQHHLLVFDGNHEWPPKETISEIFDWIKFDAMRQKAIPADRIEINRFIEENDKLASRYSTDGNFPSQQEIYKKMTHFLRGLTDVTPLEAEISRLATTKEVIAHSEKQHQSLMREQGLQRRYSPEIQQQSIDWWTKESNKLRQLADSDDDSDTKQIYARLLGFLSLNCYMYSTAALKQNDVDAAGKFIEIYRLVDPENAEHRYLAAKVAARKHDPDAAFEALRQAFAIGFKDTARLESDADFNSLQSDKRFIDLLRK